MPCRFERFAAFFVTGKAADRYMDFESTGLNVSLSSFSTSRQSSRRLPVPALNNVLA